MPRIRYKNAAGIPLKGATTVAKQLGWGQGALMWWANKQGLEGRTLQESYDTATRPGTLTHAYIEIYLKHGDKPEDMPIPVDYSIEEIEKACTAFANFEKWTEQFEFKPLHVEPNLVSEKYQFGGTPDVVAEVLGEPALVDWKTGKIYESTFLQLAAYSQLIRENYPELKGLDGGFHILRIPKNEDVPSFHHHHWGALPAEAWEAFEMCLRLGIIEKELKKYL